MGGLLFFIILFSAAVVALLFVALIGGIVWYVKNKKRKAFVACVREQFLKERPELKLEEFQLRISRIFQRSGCCHAIMWEEVDTASGKSLRHFCDNCGKENIKTIRGYAVKERQ